MDGVLPFLSSTHVNMLTWSFSHLMLILAHIEAWLESDRGTRIEHIYPKVKVLDSQSSILEYKTCN